MLKTSLQKSDKAYKTDTDILIQGARVHNLKNVTVNSKK